MYNTSNVVCSIILRFSQAALYLLKSVGRNTHFEDTFVFFTILHVDIPDVVWEMTCGHFINDLDLDLWPTYYGQLGKKLFLFLSRYQGSHLTCQILCGKSNRVVPMCDLDLDHWHTFQNWPQNKTKNQITEFYEHLSGQSHV